MRELITRMVFNSMNWSEQTRAIRRSNFTYGERISFFPLQGEVPKGKGVSLSALQILIRESSYNQSLVQLQTKTNAYEKKLKSKKSKMSLQSMNQYEMMQCGLWFEVFSRTISTIAFSLSTLKSGMIHLVKRINQRLKCLSTKPIHLNSIFPLGGNVRRTRESNILKPILDSINSIKISISQFNHLTVLPMQNANLSKRMDASSNNRSYYVQLSPNNLTFLIFKACIKLLQSLETMRTPFLQFSPFGGNPPLGGKGVIEFLTIDKQSLNHNKTACQSNNY